MEINLNLFSWWLTIFLLGATSLPIASLLFKGFTDLGWGLSKSIGILVASFIMFLLSTGELVPFTQAGIVFSIAVWVMVNAYVASKIKSTLVAQIRRGKAKIIVAEALFTIGFFFWTWIRGFNPDILGLEKLMDYGFINSILRSRFLPPQDMWFAGKAINYYWFGHFITAFLTKLVGVSSGTAYNLMIATILGLTLSGVFSFASSLFYDFDKNIRKAIIAGVLSATMVAFAGNFHAPLYMFKEGYDSYWYPDATRFIGYNPDVDDKTIHEFPLYSFVVSDLHAHLLNLPFVILFIALLFSFIKETKMRTFKIGFLGFLLGIFYMTNTWDVGNYLVLTACVLTLYGFLKIRPISNTIKFGVKNAIILAVTAALTALPFHLNFESIAQGVDFVRSNTPLWQLAVLWGFPGLLTIMAVFIILKDKRIKINYIFVLGVLSAAWILIILPEIIYVKDIYIASHHRANTMFKLTYQAFVMSYSLSGFIALAFLSKLKGFAKGSMVFVVAVVFTSLLTYPFKAISSYYGELKTYTDIEGEDWIKRKYPNEHQVILWFRDNVDGQPVILEAPGDSYTEFNVISSYTGLPTVSGWFVHEWLWRGDPSFPQNRVNDIQEIYTSKDVEKIRSLIEKYSIEYIVVGTFEKQKYPQIDENVYEKLGRKVFSSGKTLIYKID